MLLKQLADGFRGTLGNPDVDKAQVVADMAKSLVDIADRPDLRQSVATLVRNNFLSAPSTTFKNFMGNLARVIEAPITRFASGLATLDAKRMKEAGDILVGYTKAFAEVFPRFIGGYQNRNIVFDGRTSKEVDFYLRFPGQDPSKELSTFDKGLNAVVTFPQSLQRGIDEGFSTFFERAQYQVIMNRLKNAPNEEILTRLGMTRDELVDALETAVTSKARGGKRNIREERLFDSIAAIDPEAAKLVEEFSLNGTFRSKLGDSLIDKAASNYFKFSSEKLPELAFITPFIITPLNVAKFGSGFVPGLGVLRMRQAAKDIKRLVVKKQSLISKLNTAKNDVTIARLKKQISETSGEIKSKQQLKNDFMGQQLLGLGFTGWTYSMLQDGQLSGDYPSNPALRARMQEQGIPPNSVKIGDRWVSYSGIEPLHTVFAIFANGKEKAEQQRLEGNETASIQTIASVAEVVKSSFLDKTFTVQLGEFMNAVTSEEGLNKVSGMAVGASNGLTPNLFNMIARLEDPVRKQTKDEYLPTWILNNMKARLPGLRSDLPDRVSPITGEPVSLGSSAEITSGFKFEEVNRNRLQKLFDNPELKIAPPSSNLFGVTLNNEQYSRMSQLMGENTNQALNYMASSEGFMLLPDSLQAKAIKDVVSSIRSDIRKMVLGELIQDKSSKEFTDFINNEYKKKGINPYTNPDYLVN
tara:strand:- start:668 stop:2758 length:2091 start_codon:yes stop_codon:yes gene_type:complete